MQRRSILAAALAAFLPVRVSPFPAMPMVNAVATGGTGDGTWFRVLHDDDLWPRAMLEERGEWPPARIDTAEHRAAQDARNRYFSGEIGRIERFTIHTSEVL